MIADIAVTEKSFGNKSLMSDVRFAVSAGEKVGVVGRNGVGKSTLFGMLAGTDTDFSGDITYKRGLVVVATAQEHAGIASDVSVLAYILSGLPEYQRLSHIIETYPDTMGSNVTMISDYTDALQRFDDLGYYTIEQAITRELERFQLEHTAHRPFVSLSGGQKRLAEIVKVMHSNAQLALIDEPTNHMDYVAKAQFIEWLESTQLAVLVITHDRDVLGVVDRIVELKDGRAVSYVGNYDAYLRQNAHSTSTGMQDFETIQRQIDNLKAKVTQFRRLKERSRDPDTIKQFKRRELAAEKELQELLAIPRPSFWIDTGSVANLSHKAAGHYDKYKARNIKLNGLADGSGSRSSRILAHMRELSLGYGDREPLFDNLHLTLREKESIELRGRNGAGKTTVIRSLLASATGANSGVHVLHGDISVDQHVQIGVYEQEVDDRYFNIGLADAIEKLYLDANMSIGREKVMRLMQSYLFDPIADAGIRVGDLSGGQKARFQLIDMLKNDPELLILDEPTNHLDLPSIEELESALSRYSGAILYVSHDGYFRDAIGGETVLVGAQ